MSLKHGLLGLLDDEPLSGYDLLKIFNNSLNFFWSATTSQVYRDLNSMEKAGWLTSTVEVQIEKPSKRIYSITDDGRKEFFDWLNTFNFCNLGGPRDKVLIKIFFAAKGDRQKLILGLEEYIAMNQNQIEEHEKIRNQIESSSDSHTEDVRVYWLITLLRGLELARANIAWARQSIDMLRAL